MAKILVLFYSDTGNTEKMAQLVKDGAGEIEGHEIRVKHVKEAVDQDVIWCDGLAIGCPTHMGSVPWEMKKFWDVDMRPHWGTLDGKIGCAFASQGGWGGGAELNCLALQLILQNYGFLTFGITDYSGKQFTLHYGATQAGEPRIDKEQEACRRLGRRLAEWLAVYLDGRKEENPHTSGRKRFPWK